MESLMLQRQQKDKKSMLNQKIIPADKNWKGNKAFL
jgi:hypothetical protein